MDGLFTLLALSAVMAIASFVAGVLPLAINLSQRRMRLISTLGMGVLVGTALIVIIPEGVETLYNSNTKAPAVVKHYTVAGSAIKWAREAIDYDGLLSKMPGIDPSNMAPGPVRPESIQDPPKTPTTPGVVGIMGSDTESGSDPEDHGTMADQDTSTKTNHAWIGVALLSGFVLMFLIDKVPQYTQPKSTKPRTHHISLNNLGQRFNLTSGSDSQEAENFLGNDQPAEPKGRSFATTTGLVIHAAADGIALGASTTTTSSHLSFIIFFAIMLHKAPAAFGLTSILLRQGLSKRIARAHLVLFSLAAPTGALLTWFLVRMMRNGAVQDSSATQWWTGILLLFSAGTFLYVAMHSMQEVLDEKEQSHSMNGHGVINGTPDPSRVDQNKPSMLDLVAAVFGMILPLFLQIGHAH